MTVFDWIKREWLTVLIAAGIVISLYMVVTSSSRRDERDRARSVAGCTRTGTTKALDAAAWIRAAEARRNDGNEPAANYYEGIADGLILTIPAPTQNLHGSRALARVTAKHINGRVRYVLTPEAQRLQRLGCERAYMA